MKKTILIILICFQLFAKSQHFAGSFAELKLSGKRISQLDSIYKNSVGAGDVVFGSAEDLFIASYKKLMQDLGAHLKLNGFSFGKSTRSFTRVYFKADGSIDYFLYNFKESEATPEKINTFDKLLKKFVTTCKIGITAPVDFAQCSPTIFQ